MKKRILLINPWIYDFAAYDFWVKPLGLLSIAAFLRLNGYHIEFIDCLDPWNPRMRSTFSRPLPRRLPTGRGRYFKEVIPKPDPLKMIPKNYHRYGITPEIFCGMVKGLPPPDLILVTSMMTYWYPGVSAAIAILKDLLPGVPVVLGGNYVSLCPDHASRSGADFLLPGEGEIHLPGFLAEMWGDKPPFIPDTERLDSYPYPLYDLILHPEHAPLLTSRGCLFHCTYCASRVLNPLFRRRDPEKVFAELLFWHRQLGIENFSLYDDAFLVRPEEMALPLLREIVKHRLPFQFHCPNGLHLREITDETAALLYGAGFKTIRFGFETSDFTRQMETGGKVSNREFLNAVKSLKKAGYRADEIGVYILCGMPGQRAKEVGETIAFVRSCGGRPILAEYSPIPQTDLWEEAVRVSPFNIAEEPLYHNNSLLPCRNDDLTYDKYLSLKQLTRLP